MAPLDVHYVTMTNYDEDFRGLHVVYDKPNLVNTLGEVVSAQGLTQLRMAETEKYPHVTYFFSGGREAPFQGERRVGIRRVQPSALRPVGFRLHPERLRQFRFLRGIERPVLRGLRAGRSCGSMLLGVSVL